MHQYAICPYIFQTISKDISLQKTIPLSNLQTFPLNLGDVVLKPGILRRFLRFFGRGAVLRGATRGGRDAGGEMIKTPLWMEDSNQKIR